MLLNRTTAFALALLLLVASAAPAHARRPHFGEDARITETGKLEFETGFEWANRSRTPGSYLTYGVPLRLNWGARPGLDVSLVTAAVRANPRGFAIETGITDTRLLVKRALTPKELPPDEKLAWYLDAKLPTGDDKKSLLLGNGEADLGLGLAWEAGSDGNRYRMSGSFHAAGDPEGVDYKNYATYSFGVERPTDRGIVAVAELYGRTRVFETDESSQLVLLVGTKKEWRKNLVFDTGLAFGLTESSPSLVAKTGLSTSF